MSCKFYKKNLLLLQWYVATLKIICNKSVGTFIAFNVLSHIFYTHSQNTKMGKAPYSCGTYALFVNKTFSN